MVKSLFIILNKVIVASLFLCCFISAHGMRTNPHTCEGLKCLSKKSVESEFASAALKFKQEQTRLYMLRPEELVRNIRRPDGSDVMALSTRKFALRRDSLGDFHIAIGEASYQSMQTILSEREYFLPLGGFSHRVLAEMAPPDEASRSIKRQAISDTLISAGYIGIAFDEDNTLDVMSRTGHYRPNERENFNLFVEAMNDFLFDAGIKQVRHIRDPEASGEGPGKRHPRVLADKIALGLELQGPMMDMEDIIYERRQVVSPQERRARLHAQAGHSPSVDSPAERSVAHTSGADTHRSVSRPHAEATNHAHSAAAAFGVQLRSVHGK